MCDFSKNEFRAWVAAWIDTEGSICIIHGNKGDGNLGHSLRVIVAQKDVRPLKMIKEKYGGYISKVKNKTKIYHLHIVCRKALAMLIDVMDFLVVKKEQAKVALHFYETFDEKDWIYGPTNEEALAERNRCMKQIRKLNHYVPAFTSV